MRALLLMFVMLTSSITIAQEGLYLNFDCDYPLRLERVSKVQTLGNTEVFATVSVSSDPNTTVTSIFSNYNFIYNDVVDSHIEDWDSNVFNTYLINIENKIVSAIVRIERIAELEAAFVQYGTSTVNISLIKDNDGNDAILFSNNDGTITLDVKFNNLLENLLSHVIPTTIVSYFNTYVGLIQGEIDAAALIAATAANDTAFNAALDANTASSTLDRELELEGLSRDGVEVRVDIYTQGFKISFHDANGPILVYYDDGTSEPEATVSNTNLNSVTDYGTMYNNIVNRVRDLVQNLIDS